MGWLDKILAVTDVAGVGYNLGQEIAKLDPFGFNVDPYLPPAGGTGQPSAPPTTAFGGGFSTGGGTSMAWDDFGGGFPLVTTRGARRGLIPYSGGVIPSGYRVANRAARAPTAGLAAGTYLVPRRSMNPLNPRALMRAERRLNMFSTWVKRHFKIAAAAPKRRTKRRRR
jgi:hypothetical protein